MAQNKYKPFFTIGYEGVTPDKLVAELKVHHVTRLVDVRAVPLSRKKGFSKNVLRLFLAEHGIEYSHLRALGTPPSGRDAVRKNKLVLFREIFNAHMQTIEALQGLEQAVALTENETICLLCFEADPGHCHRTIIAQMISEKTRQKFTALQIEPDLIA